MNESGCFVVVCFAPGDVHSLSAKLGEFIARPNFMKVAPRMKGFYSGNSINHFV